jgi:peptidoglycan/LPS O-acetylase OafA/YrhL
LWPYFTMMQNNVYAVNGADLNFISPSWSLAIEEQFYLVFPLVFFWRRSMPALAAVLAASIVLFDRNARNRERDSRAPVRLDLSVHAVPA